MGGYEPGQLVYNEAFPVVPDEVETFLQRLTEFSFWSASAENRIGLDGANWIMEGVCDGKYQLVERWSPDNGAFREAALLLVALAHITVQNIY